MALPSSIISPLASTTCIARTCAAVTPYLTQPVNFNVYDCGYICCKSQGIENDIKSEGCGCLISCKWELVSPKLSDMYFSQNKYYLLGILLLKKLVII